MDDPNILCGGCHVGGVNAFLCKKGEKASSFIGKDAAVRIPTTVCGRDGDSCFFTLTERSGRLIVIDIVGGRRASSCANSLHSPW